MSEEKKSAEGVQAFPKFLTVWKFWGELRCLPVTADYPGDADERMYLSLAEHDAIRAEDAAQLRLLSLRQSESFNRALAAERTIARLTEVLERIAAGKYLYAEFESDKRVGPATRESLMGQAREALASVKEGKGSGEPNHQAEGGE